MKPYKKHKVKREILETSSRFRDTEEHDLAYYIHDRVELMHQVFSVIKPKELKSLAPDCVRHISIDDLQELCTEELLGISSKRLCAIMDGGEPPTDTESSSSSPEQLETISLDSISSDDEILSQPSSKGKKHKHRKRNKSKSKHKHRDSKRSSERSSEERSRASRAGLTVLELLELQARARAIRAQLQQDNATKATGQVEAATRNSSGDDEVEIKEEAPEVVEISSEDEKPNIQELEDKQSKMNKATETTDCQKTVTKRVNDLVITVPQTKQPRKIKLNRNKAPVTNIQAVTAHSTAENPTVTASSGTRVVTNRVEEVAKLRDEKKEKLKKKQKRKQRKADSDHDEITLQLSDTEKMDLLEDMDRKNYDIVTSSSEDSGSSSESDSDRKEDKSNDKNEETKEKYTTRKEIDAADVSGSGLKRADSNPSLKSPCKNVELENNHSLEIQSAASDENTEKTAREPIGLMEEHEASEISANSIKCAKESVDNNVDLENNVGSSSNVNELSDLKESLNVSETKESREVEEGEIANNNTNLSEGELSDRDNTAPSDPVQEVVCISDDDGKSKKRKKNKKKEKKSKKDKRRKSDFREGADQNFYPDTGAAIDRTDIDGDDRGMASIDKDSGNNEISKEVPTADNSAEDEILCIDEDDTKEISINKIEKLDDVKNDNVSKRDADTSVDDEVFELSDDSSVSEVEGISVLSKEPTKEEIEALSAKIDVTVDCEVNDEDGTEEYEMLQGTELSWKERYLDSRKVKQVLSTANILNALRKKNKELKKKLADDKEMEKLDAADAMNLNSELEASGLETGPVEGSIDQFNTLQGSTKYVAPVAESKQKASVSKEMEKDAKQLLKMYKKLLKYNDMNRQKDPGKRKKKKHKKNKDRDNEKAS